MPFKTRVTQLLGIEHPIIQGGMQWVGVAELASAVSNAGGLGLLTGLTQPTPEALRNEIRRCRGMTSKPFGVNLTFLPAMTPPPYDEYAKVIIEENIKIVETAGSNPGKYIKMFKDAGIIVIHKCTTVRHALTAEKMGVDIVSIDGFECAGHPGEYGLGLAILLAKSAMSLKVPYVASGGIANAGGLAAALAFGADGVNMGTRFMCTAESPIHENIKQAIVDADETQTTLVFRPFRNTSRIFKNKVAEEVNEIESRPNATFNDIMHLVAGSRGRQVYTTGDPEFGVWTAGQCIGLIEDIPTCDVLISRMVKGAEDIFNKRIGTMMTGKAKM
ncbi:hypothetical protein BC940DRAFT_287403 [Gongronella butleri]|nr:hypothetical protein BC940DRAFT_287403 [Gongronella butleri]